MLPQVSDPAAQPAGIISVLEGAAEQFDRMEGETRAQEALRKAARALRAFRRAGLCSDCRGLCLLGCWVVGLSDWLAGWLDGWLVGGWLACWLVG